MANLSLPTHEAELDKLQELGFPINPLNQKIEGVEGVWGFYEKLESEVSGLNYPIDGLVVKHNDNDLVDSLGIVGKTPRGWCALKFAAEEVTTKLIDIAWQVGRTGKITPVAELEPVEIVGTTVRRATLHNYQEFVDKDLRKGDLLVIRKAGEIIPEVVKVVLHNERDDGEKMSAPKDCPSCSTELVASSTGIDLYCPNEVDCKAKIIGRLSYYAQRSLGNITGLSEKQIEKFYEEFGIKDIPDLFDLPYHKIFELEGYKAKSVENLKKSVEDAQEIVDYKFLAGLGVEGVGPEVAKLILEVVGSSDTEDGS
jgi:DNA ligase (NAD+)